LLKLLFFSLFALAIACANTFFFRGCGDPLQRHFFKDGSRFFQTVEYAVTSVETSSASIAALRTLLFFAFALANAVHLSSFSAPHLCIREALRGFSARGGGGGGGEVLFFTPLLFLCVNSGFARFKAYLRLYQTFFLFFLIGISDLLDG